MTMREIDYLYKQSALMRDTDNLVDLLCWRAQHQPDKLAYTFLLDGEEDAAELTYSQLDQSARKIAVWLQANTDKGERALILHPPGLDYIAAFMGCLYAGVIAVPAYPPRINNRPMPRLQAIVADAQARVALTTERILESIERRFDQAPDLASLRWLATDDFVAEGEWVETAVSATDLAFFQYTSGSTAAPKGVMLTHGNLLHNLGLISAYFECGDDEHGVIWLPPYHDMGLIGGILEPLYRGFPVTLMSPVAFLQKPVRWLRAISERRGTQSGGPNFAFDLCVDKITPEQCHGLDLSSWRVAFNGAEPVRAETIQRFTEAFAPYGFRPEAFYPTYGMAEATLLISGSVVADLPQTLVVDRVSLGRHEVETAVIDSTNAQTLVGSGRILAEQTVLIVDPETNRALADSEIGEIWAASPSIAQGYWHKPEATERSFKAHLADGSGPFLRTGDLGFMREGQLYVTGRLKDLIIIRGRNHYPQDVEQTVADCHPAFARDGGAAFSVDIAGEERLVVVQELEREYRKTAVSELSQAARKAIAAEHSLELYALALLSPLRIPRTSSGKIKRHACRAGYLNNTLNPIAVWKKDEDEIRDQRFETQVTESKSSVSHLPSPGSKTAAEVEDWLIDRLAKQLKLAQNQIDAAQPFDSYGLDSLVAIELSGELGRWLGRDLPGNLLLDYDSIAALAAHLGKGAREQGSRGEAVPPRSPAPLPPPIAHPQVAHPFTAYVNPYLGELLEQFKMDKRFVRAEGCWLWDDRGERYLDFIAMYGALPFGFNHPEIWGAVTDVAAMMPPSFAQPSMLDAAGELAQRLIELAPPGLKYVTYANSGAEAVEAAVKLVRAATGKLGILSTDNSFHGKTLGALSATGRPYYQKPFGAPAHGFNRVPYGDLAVLEAELSRRDDIAAFIVEPIQGEGGIVVPPVGYLAGVRELCSRYGVLMIVDEIQTGLGRTGHLFVCETERVRPDVLVVAKALGGGLMPIGAMLATEEAYVEEFAIKHTSTFAANTLACRVGLRSLELLTRDNQALLWQVAENGAYLKAGLQKLQQRYPDILTAVRGRGYMLGLEFNNDRAVYGRQCLLGPMAEQEMLTAVIASYMLNVERIRVAPTLNGNSVLRLEPPLIADRAMCDQVIGAVERLLMVLRAGSTAKLMAHLVGRSDIQVGALRDAPLPQTNAGPQDGDGRFAFLVHPLTPRSYVDFDASLAVFSDEELADLTQRWQGTVEPFVVGTTRITSADGPTAYGEFIGIPFTADELMAMPQAEAAAELRKGVELAQARGAKIVGLGSYTSIASQNGRLLTDVGLPLTTGNSYTVVSTVQAIAAAAEKLNVDLAAASVAIIGATGSIGRATALLLAKQVKRLILIGNPAHPEQSLARLQVVAEDVAAYLGHQNGASVARAAANGRIILTTDINQYLPQADIVVTATSSTQNMITAANLKPGAIVCDTARPSNVSTAVQQARPDVLVIDGGIIAVPGQPDLGWQFGLEPGLSFACMAETMILGLEQYDQHGSLGLDLPVEFLATVRQLADKHGFGLAQISSFDRPLTKADWRRVLASRSQSMK